METEIKLLKEREVDQKNKASGYETLLRDGIPLNEHFLALKNKFNNEQDLLKKQVEIMEHEIKTEELSNKQRNKKIEILKSEYELYHQKYLDYKNATTNKKLDHEFKLYTEEHTKAVLTLEKQVFYDKVANLKADNQVMGRNITKDKYHNNRDEDEKTRKRKIEELQEDIDLLKDEIFKLQSLKEEEEERNADPALLKKQKESTMNLK